jgi:dienelactone hydrolase
METVEYAPGRLVDLYGERAHPTVLLWHGAQTDARATLRPLAERVSGHGRAVVVPDWNSQADDGGRADLLRSVHYAGRRTDAADGIVLVGWSLGGVAAAGLTLHARRFDIHLVHTVCLAGAFVAPDPISGGDVYTMLSVDAERSPFTLLHGIADDVVPAPVSRAFASALDENHWPFEFVELTADHATIAGASYDPVAGRYSAGRTPEALAVAADVAARIAAAHPSVN